MNWDGAGVEGVEAWLSTVFVLFLLMVLGLFRCEWDFGMWDIWV